MEANTLDTIGTVLDGPQPRDAVHIATMAVRLAAPAMPGEPLRIVHWSQRVAAPCRPPESQGILDPFLNKNQTYYANDWLWMFLHPKSVRSITHQWIHSGIDFPSQDDRIDLDTALAGIAFIARQLRIETSEVLAMGDYYQATRGEHLENAPVDAEAFAPYVDAFWCYYGVIRGVPDDQLAMVNPIYEPCAC